MRPVLFERRTVVLSAFGSLEITPVKMWKNELFARNLEAVGFRPGEEFAICYKVFTDEYAFIGELRETPKEAATNETTSADGSTGNSAGDSKPRSV